MNDHILDRPIWSTLITSHADLATGNGLARRFFPEVSALAAVGDDSPESLAALAELIPDGAMIMTAQPDPVRCPPGACVTLAATVLQMMLERAPQTAEDAGYLRLGAADAAEMLALAELTRPGPFTLRTHELGEYWGVKVEGQLVAMAGERMKQPGFSEISGVCTHPDFQGRGYARGLCALLAARISARGETPYLHVFETNTHAVGLYERMGFQTRRVLHVAAIERA